MTEAAVKIKDQLLALSEQDRLEIADLLLSSVECADEDAEAVFDKELDRRWQEIEDGTDDGIPFEDLNAKLREKYS